MKDEKYYCIFLWMAVKQTVVEVGRLKISVMRNSLQEFLAVKAFGLEVVSKKALKIYLVVWRAHLPVWIKINMDGVAKRNGLAWGGAVFRNCRETFLGAFSVFF